MKRFEERKDDLKKATNKLNEALRGDASDLEIDGILHRFEFTFELAWKTMKDCLEEQSKGMQTRRANFRQEECFLAGLPIMENREIIKEAFSVGLIDNGEVWIDMMLSRNELSHLYDEETSRKIYDNIKEIYILEINKLIQKLDTI